MNNEYLINEFLNKGIVKIPVENACNLTKIKEIIWLAGLHNNPSTTGQDLNTIHWNISIKDLNQFRLNIINKINSESWFKSIYFSLAKHALETLVGNELVMQRNINLSIQLPNDDSSLLPIHCDTWSGDSPYEVVLWVPLVDCYDTKSMFFVDRAVDKEVQKNMHKYATSEELYEACRVRNGVKFIDVKYGECLIFTQNIMHGNRVNETTETRWSMNCRFKSALTPYADKKLGEFFEPITIRPATRLGAEYVMPRL